MAVYDDVSPDQKVVVYDAGVSTVPTLGEYETMGEFQWRIRAGDIHIPHIRMDEPLLLELEDFARACLDGGVPTASAMHGLDVVRVLAAIQDSTERKGAPVALDW